jgi:hypothetical protein
MGIFMVEAEILNLIVPVGSIGLPLFLVNMWLCFIVGGVVGDWIGERGVYRLMSPELRRKVNTRWFVLLPAAAVEFAIGVAFFSVGNWDYVFTNCWTGNACTFFQLAPVLFLVIGAICLVGFVVLVVTNPSPGPKS